eukprot:5438510-Pyramimonas_sp.AAC.1
MAFVTAQARAPRRLRNHRRGEVIFRKGGSILVFFVAVLFWLTGMMPGGDGPQGGGGRGAIIPPDVVSLPSLEYA